MKWFLYSLILLFFAVDSYGQVTSHPPVGLPFVQSYLADEYRGELQNWAITQDARGIMYVGNGVGVLAYDGNRWATVYVANKSVVRSLATGLDGIVYVGAKAEFGYLSTLPNGKQEYISLKSKLDTAFHGFGDVWQIIPTTHGVYFNAGEFAFLYHQDKVTAISNTGNGLHRAYGVDDEFFVIEKGAGLLTVKNDSLVALGEPAKVLDGKRVYALFSYNKTHALYGITNEGFFLGIKPTLITQDNPLVLERFITEVDDWMNENFLYTAQLLDNGGIIIGTLGGGIAELDRQGKLVRMINQSNKLEANSIYALYQNSEGAIWLALSKGIAQLETGAPISHWGKSEGLAEPVINIAYHRNQLYVSTFDGLYRYQNQKFVPVENASDYGWSLENITWGSSKKERLFFAARMGVYEVIEDKCVLIAPITNCNEIFYTETAPNRLVISHTSGLATIEEVAPNQWKQQTIVETPDEFRKIGMSDGVLWAASLQSGIYQIEPNQDWSSFDISIYDDTTQIVSPENNNLVNVGTELWAVNSKTDAYFTQKNNLLPLKGNSLLYSDSLEKQLTTATIIHSHIDGENTWLLIEATNLSSNKLPPIIALKVGDAPFQFYPNTLGRMAGTEILTAYALGDSVFLVGTADGLFRLDMAKQQAPKIPIQAFPSRVVFPPDSTIFYGGLKNSQLDKIIPYQFNSIVFEFGSNYYQSQDLVMFSYLLEDHDEEWSVWSDKKDKEYTDLYEGTYKMKVRIKTPYGEESLTGNYSFEIAPPYYRTWWAYAIYLLMAVAVITIFAKLNALRHKAENRRLEGIVTERTREVTLKNEEINQQNEEILRQNEVLETNRLLLEKKNKDVGDSINAAKRILSALHTSPDIMQRKIEESFVFHQPREAVSGDFFWFEESGSKLFIAAVDCTGHGIPGAFMSVIGHTLLKDTVNLYQTNEADQVLNNLHYLVANSLSRENKGSVEGMDMTLCIIDTEKQELQFAGARNPLIYIQNGELTVIKGDRLPVGGIKLERPRQFTKHTIPLTGDTCFYLFSDGLQDQFGGADGNQKFTSKRLQKLLLEIHHLPMEEQKAAIETAFIDWKGNYRQIDDVIFVGFKA